MSKRIEVARLWRAIVKRHRRGQRSGRVAAGGGRVGATGSEKTDRFGFVRRLRPFVFFAGFGAAFWRGARRGTGDTINPL